VKIVCVGGGPAGLYFALLMKKADPAHDITVLERNRADDTFGFGVVFSDATLDNFAQADPETHRQITGRDRVRQPDGVARKNLRRRRRRQKIARRHPF